MRVVYVAGPYRAKTIFGVLWNIWHSWWVAFRLWSWGYAVICPHTSSMFMDWAGRWFLRKDIPFIKGDLEIIDRMREGLDFMVLRPRWQKSEGTKSEIERAHNISLKVYEWEHDWEYLKARGGNA